MIQKVRKRNRQLARQITRALTETQRRAGGTQKERKTAPSWLEFKA